MIHRPIVMLVSILALAPHPAEARYIPVPTTGGSIYTYSCDNSGRNIARLPAKHALRPTPTAPFRLTLEQLSAANVGAYVKNAPTTPQKARLGLYLRRGADTKTLQKLGLASVKRLGKAPGLRFVKSMYDPARARQAVKLLQHRADNPYRADYRP